MINLMIISGPRGRRAGSRRGRRDLV